MIVGIDASNIRSGGGVTHLMELLRAANPHHYGFSEVVVWGSEGTLAQLAERSWLTTHTDPVMELSYSRRALWQRNRFGDTARAAQCDLLFVPGGSFATEFRPIVTMSQNLLPFDLPELWRYRFSPITIKLLVLRLIQSRSFRRAQGVIFLSKAARETVLRVTGSLRGACPIIPHGLDPRFRMKPKPQRSIQEYDADEPFRIIYVSIVDQYKHQWQVVDAVCALRHQGWPLVLDLVGPSYPPALDRLRSTIAQDDPDGRWVSYHGAIAYSDLHQLYAQADLGVFASSCENMPNILLETMAAGLPVACSDRGPMPEVLGDAGVYFDPENSEDIALALGKLIASPELRAEKAKASYSAALVYDWKRCADETFEFLSLVAGGFRQTCG